MQHLEVSGAVRQFFKSLGFKGLIISTTVWQGIMESLCVYSSSIKRITLFNITLSSGFFVLCLSFKFKNLYLLY